MKKSILKLFLLFTFLFSGMFFYTGTVLSNCGYDCTDGGTQYCIDNCPACNIAPCSYTCQRDPLSPYDKKICYVTEEPSTTLCPDDKWCPWGVCNYQDPFWLQTRFCCDPNITEYQIRQCRSDGEPGCPDDMTGNFDGVCGQCEDASSCSSDCGGCIPIRGDGECNCGETPNSCFLL
jgi:hypothetical protein